MDAILPAAGSATRMGSIPKFLLPCDVQGLSLIQRHITNIYEHVETIWIPTNTYFEQFLFEYFKKLPNIKIFATTTCSMTETLQKVVQKSNQNQFMVIMPDTYFYGELPYSYLASPSSIPRVALWQIRPSQKGKLGQVDIDERNSIKKIVDKDPNCDYLHLWGAFSAHGDEILGVEPHLAPGHILENLIEAGCQVDHKVFVGNYFDCGTPAEYFSLLETIIFQKS